MFSLAIEQPSVARFAPLFSIDLHCLVSSDSNLAHFYYGYCHCCRRRQLAGTPHEPHLRLLETFAYGTYADAQAKADQLPKLTEAQVSPSSSDDVNEKTLTLSECDFLLVLIRIGTLSHMTPSSPYLPT